MKQARGWGISVAVSSWGRSRSIIGYGKVFPFGPESIDRVLEVREKKLPEQTKAKRGGGKLKLWHRGRRKISGGEQA